MNMPNRKAAEMDIMDMKLVPLSEVAEGSCRHRKNNGELCKRRAVVMGVCPSHLQSIGGHLFITDYHDPEYPGWDKKKDFSYCRACGELENGSQALELCPVRRTNPAIWYPPSPKLPKRLQYKFARPERKMIILGKKQVKATCYGPFVAYRIEPDVAGLTWEVLHLQSQRKVAHRDSEKASVDVMRRICDGIDLDFTDTINMNRKVRDRINHSAGSGDGGRPAHMPGGILNWTAAKARYRTKKATGFYWMKEKERVECWGPFGFAEKDGGVELYCLDQPQHGSIFWIPSHKQAIAFSKAATALNLNWRQDWYRTESRYYEPEVLHGIAKLVADIEGIRMILHLWGLLPSPPLPSLPSVPVAQPIEISIATTEGPRSVSAYVVAEHFAIHRPLSFQVKCYILTHIPTGYQMGWCNDLQTCLTAALELASLGGWEVADQAAVASRFKMRIPDELEMLQRHGLTTSSSWGVTMTINAN